MIETTGRVIEICKLSRLMDQITVLVVIPSPTEEEQQTRSLEWAVPSGAVKVGTTVKMAFLD